MQKGWCVGVLVFIIFGVHAGAQTVQLNAIALSGQAAPGGGVFNSFDASKVDLNGDGVLAFVGFTDLGAGLWTLDGGSLSLVAIQGQPAPGLGANVFYSSEFRIPSINDAGDVAFITSLQGTGVGSIDYTAAWMAHSGGSIELIARAGATAPGGIGSYSPSMDRVQLNNAGQLALHQTPIGSPQPAPVFPWATFVGNIGSLELIAASGQQPPGRTTTFALVADPLLSETGQIAFLGVEAPINSGKAGVWGGSFGGINVLAADGVLAPGTGGGSFDGGGFQAPDLARNGYLAIKGAIHDSNNDGIWYQKPGAALELLVRDGMPAPGTSTVFSGFWFLHVNTSGLIAFNGYAENEGWGIWAGGENFALRKVVMEGDSVPGQSPAAEFLMGPNNFAIDENGVVVFEGAFEPNNGSGIGYGLWAALPDGELMNLLLLGQTLAIDGEARVLDAFNWYPPTSPARFPGRNVPDRFRHFTDGSSGLFGISVPEPATAGLVMTLLSLLMTLRRRDVTCP